MRRSIASSASFVLALMGAVLAPALARAHVAISSGPAVANSSAEIVFAVGHGCAGLDTLSVKIDIPAAVTSVRAGSSDLGPATFDRDAALKITAVTFEKPEAALIAGDDNFYKVTLRIKVPNTPFASLYFPVHQTCKAPGGSTTTVVDWVGTAASEAHAGDAGAAVEPAAVLTIVPAWKPGWNRFTVPVALANTELSTFFASAQVVWRGNAAYSANPTTSEQIEKTSGVLELTALAVGDEIWVKF